MSTLFKTKKRMYVFIGLLAAVITYKYFFTGRPEDSIEKRIREKKYFRDDRYSGMEFLERLGARGIFHDGVHDRANIEDFLANLSRENSDTIHTPSGWHFASNKIDSYCRKLMSDANPDTGVEPNYDSYVDCVWEFANEAFPEQAENIFDYFHRFHKYQLWVKQSGGGSDWRTPKTGRERMDEIWEKRYEIFGKEIVEDIYRRQLVEKNGRELVEKISGKRGMTLDEKLEDLNLEIKKVARDDEDLAANRDQFLNTFLRSKKVQDQLAEMVPAERRDALERVRRTMGYDEDDIRAMTQRDEQKEIEREKGMKYLRKEEELAEHYRELQKKYRDDDAILEEEKRKMRISLTAYRKSLFGERGAREIEKEEKNGLYRYRGLKTEKRVYGIN